MELYDCTKINSKSFNLYYYTSLVDWQIVHFIGVIFLLILLVCREKYFDIKTKVFNVTLDLTAFRDDLRRYSQRDLVWIITFSLICILGFGVSIFIHILVTFELLNTAYIYFNFNIINPYFDMLVIMYISILGIFYLVVKGIKVGSKKELKKGFYLWLPAIVICLVIFCPFLSFGIEPVFCAILDILGFGFFISFLNFVIMGNELVQ